MAQRTGGAEYSRCRAQEVLDAGCAGIRGCRAQEVLGAGGAGRRRCRSQGVPMKWVAENRGYGGQKCRG